MQRFLSRLAWIKNSPSRGNLENNIEKRLLKLFGSRFCFWNITPTDNGYMFSSHKQCKDCEYAAYKLKRILNREQYSVEKTKI